MPHATDMDDDAIDIYHYLSSIFDWIFHPFIGFLLKFCVIWSTSSTFERKRTQKMLFECRCFSLISVYSIPLVPSNDQNNELVGCIGHNLWLIICFSTHRTVDIGLVVYLGWLELSRDWSWQRKKKLPKRLNTFVLCKDLITVKNSCYATFDSSSWAVSGI
jgi:hypothetical protein